MAPLHICIWVVKLVLSFELLLVPFLQLVNLSKNNLCHKIKQILSGLGTKLLIKINKSQTLQTWVYVHIFSKSVNYKTSICISNFFEREAITKRGFTFPIFVERGHYKTWIYIRAPNFVTLWLQSFAMDPIANVERLTLMEGTGAWLIFSIFNFGYWIFISSFF